MLLRGSGAGAVVDGTGGAVVAVSAVVVCGAVVVVVVCGGAMVVGGLTLSSALGPHADTVKTRASTEVTVCVGFMASTGEGPGSIARARSCLAPPLRRGRCPALGAEGGGLAVVALLLRRSDLPWLERVYSILNTRSIITMSGDNHPWMIAPPGPGFEMQPSAASPRMGSPG